MKMLVLATNYCLHFRDSFLPILGTSFLKNKVHQKKKKKKKKKKKNKKKKKKKLN